MSRVNALMEQQIVNRLLKLLRYMEEIKSKQYIGSDSLVIYHTKTINYWDVTDTIKGTEGLIRYRVTFIPDSVPDVFTEFGVVRLFSTNVYTTDIDVYADPTTFTSNAIRYVVAYTNQNYMDDITINLKFSIKAADTGSIIWERLS